MSGAARVAAVDGVARETSARDSAVRDTAAIECEILRALDEIKDPCSIATSVPMGLAEMGLIARVTVASDGGVEITLRLSSPVCEMVGYLRSEAIARASAIAGVRSVIVRHDSGLDWTPDLIAPAAQVRRRSRLERLRIVHESTL